MQALLDTHALLWWLTNDSSLSPKARNLCGELTNTIVVSAASAWELAIKWRLGKLPAADEMLADFRGTVERERFRLVAITPEHAVRAGLLPGPHRDPFDRMLIAQAQAEDLAIISRDSVFDAYGTRRIW